jgi:hypothetical protein
VAEALPAPTAATPRIGEAWQRVHATRVAIMRIRLRSAAAGAPARTARLILLLLALVAALVFDRLSERLDVLAGSHLRALYFLVVVQASVLDPLADRLEGVLYGHAFKALIDSARECMRLLDEAEQVVASSERSSSARRTG